MKNTTPEWEAKLKDLAAVNYNMYFGSPADRADLPCDRDGGKQQWTYEQALDELKSFITEQIRLANEEERERIRRVVLNAPVVCSTLDERDFAKRLIEGIAATLTNN